MHVHTAAISTAVRDSSGNLVLEATLETKSETIREFVHGLRGSLRVILQEGDYSDEGHPAYHPALLLKVWLYAYALRITSSRRLEQRIR